MLDKNRKTSNYEEKLLFETRPRALVTLKSAVLEFIIILVILYFFTTILRYAAIVQGNFSTLVSMPFVEGTTYFLLLLILLLFLLVLWNFLSWRSKKYTLTNQRVMIKTGIIRKKSVYMHYDKIQDITVSQSILERISYSGDIEVFGGHDRTSLILEDIPNPGEVENMINRLIEGDDVEFETYKPKSDKPKKGKSIIEEYDKKFKRE